MFAYLKLLEFVLSAIKFLHETKTYQIWENAWEFYSLNKQNKMKCELFSKLI